MSYDKECPKCKGRGQVECHDPKIPLYQCRRCHGTGNKTCNRCNGTGKIEGKNTYQRR
jgi:DnaJ-class molecular chaperone